MADHKVGGQPELGRMDMMTTLTTLGFVGSDVDVDEDSGKAIWDDLASEIGGGAATVDTPATVSSTNGCIHGHACICLVVNFCWLAGCAVRFIVLLAVF